MGTKDKKLSKKTAASQQVSETKKTTSSSKEETKKFSSSSKVVRTSSRNSVTSGVKSSEAVSISKENGAVVDQRESRAEERFSNIGGNVRHTFSAEDTGFVTSGADASGTGGGHQASSKQELDETSRHLSEFAEKEMKIESSALRVPGSPGKAEEKCICQICTCG